MPKPLHNNLKYDNDPSIEDGGFPFKVPQHFKNRIDSNDPNDPLLKQVLPSPEEQVHTVGFKEDPVADLDNNPIPSLIHKYHGRVLLIASPKCDIHCRYCFRRHFPYEAQVNQRLWAKAIDYIQKESSIHEVILSGGDPMALNEASLMTLIDKIAVIDHVKTLRIHSRTPVAAPDKAPQNLFLDWVKTTRLKVVLVIHCNHANELSDNTRALFQLYKQAGVTLLNQSVLLNGVNDDVNTLEKLSHQLFEQGVLPYYLNQLDRVQGSAHFEVKDKLALEIHQQLKQKLPGYLVPKLVKDVPDKGNKTTMS